ncbi:MAG: hypothetical protein ISP91_00080 [Pseudomonadales bacterium]|nr:hypothetical protein [Pseudomonadales bacterium]
MSANRLVIDLESFLPVQCDEQLRTALGYTSDAEIRREFLSSSHLQNLSFLQLYELGLRETTGHVRLLNRSGRVAGTILQVRINSDRSLMELDVVPSILPQDSPTLQQLVSLRLNRKLTITRVLSGEVEHRDFVGREFSRAIAPIGWAGRLNAAYSHRLAKTDMCRLSHPTVLPDGRLYLGQWLIEKVSPDFWKADLYSLESPEEAPGYRMLITLRGRRSEIAMDSRLLSLMPVSMEVLPPRLEDFFSAVLPEERPWVRKVLQHKELSAEHEMTYRVAGQDGVVQTLRQKVSSIRQGRGIYRLDSRLRVVPPEEMAMVSLNTIAIAFDLGVEQETAATPIMLPGFYRLGTFIARMKAMLKEDGHSDRVTLSIQPAATCSICNQQSQWAHYLQLELNELRLTRRQLQQLANSDKSMFSIGRSSHWKSWFSEIHASGFHLSIGLGTGEQVTIGFFADD